MTSVLNILDIANYIIEKAAEKEIKDLTNLKLQKLTYYIHAQFLIDNSSDKTNLKTITDDVFEAWPYGPVCSYLYFEFKEYKRNPLKPHKKGNSSNLKEPQYKAHKKAIDQIIKLYGKTTLRNLARQIQTESPWRDLDIDLECLDNPHISNHHIYLYYRAFPFIPLPSN
ncbi:Panacea domain-containing protein [Candidatus Phytoplasma pruni]|uniref:DUF4065 domain-containing protein n=1 Tax=Candidatus Phytoplasma pruni TaxID=479893 RepID=A0A851HI77_9MOLU|nr:type II toxin-antitoxin system antitoxin SocA domain-containing protein [Candidatus Phytoplasma pruni]NWN45523.1 DUF4065 domain-containing protein [Candidatus Phytoplasma pruni]